MTATLLQFARKGSLKPVSTEEIDQALRRHVKGNPSLAPTVQGWYGSIGMGLAAGLSLRDQIDEAKQGWADNIGIENRRAREFWALRLEILRWLDRNYEPIAFENADDKEKLCRT